MNYFSDLYAQDKRYGRWMTPRQGLSAGMDLHDWKQFITRACKVIGCDPDPERRLRKAQRLHRKAVKVMGCWGAENFLGWSIGGLIRECEYDTANRVNVRLVQLSLWEAQR